MNEREKREKLEMTEELAWMLIDECDVGDTEDGITVISNKLIEEVEGSWEKRAVVLKKDGRFYRGIYTDYPDPLDGGRYGDPTFEDGDPNFREVFPAEKTITVYE